MILALAVVVGLVVSLIRYRGSALQRIAAISLRGAWLVPLAFAMQLPLLRAPAGPRQHIDVQQVLFWVSYLLLLAFVALNWRSTAVKIVGLGLLFNLLVIASNGGLMPITPETLVQINPGSSLAQWTAGAHYGYSKDVILARQSTFLWSLSDILVLPPPFPWPTAFSLGDLIIATGIISLLQGSPSSLRVLTVESNRV
jgi:Family of unknown function (DUF5317)